MHDVKKTRTRIPTIGAVAGGTSAQDKGRYRRGSTKMGATRLVLGGAILGLFCTSFPKGVLTGSTGTTRCNALPCSCDQHGRVICDCKEDGEELILTTDGDRGLGQHTSRIAVNNCTSVILTDLSLVQMDGLLSVDIANVANLTIMRKSMELSPRAVNTRIAIRNCSIDTLPSFTFKGNIETIEFENVRIGQILAFAFANLVETETVTLKNCRIDNMEAQAFKKFDVRYLHVIGGSFGDQIPSRVMNDIEVYDKFMIDGVRMGIIRSSAFIIRKPRTVVILNCIIDSVESEAFDITTRGPVIIKNNTIGSLGFGAFLAIRADMENRPYPAPMLLDRLTFENNSLGSFEEGSLIFDRTSFRPKLNNVLVNQACDCEQLATWKSYILNYTNIYSRFHTQDNIILPPIPIDSPSDDPDTFLCLVDVSAGIPMTFVDFKEKNCEISGSLLLLVLVLAGLLLVLIVTGCLVVYYCRKRRKDAEKRWISVPTSAPDVVSKKNGVIARENATSGAPVDSRITMVVPDGRLYRETEFHVIIEKAEPLTTEL